MIHAVEEQDIGMAYSDLSILQQETTWLQRYCIKGWRIMFGWCDVNSYEKSSHQGRQIRKTNIKISGEKK